MLFAKYVDPSSIIISHHGPRTIK